MLLEFIRDVLKRTSSGQLYVCSLPNAKDGQGGGERHVLTRDPQEVVDFCARWDQKGRGSFYCVSTIADGMPRKKENYQQTCFLHADIDFKDIACTPEEAEAALEALKPSRLHFSGNGIHALWMLRDPVSNASWVETQLRRLAVVCGGDPMVAQCVALMRMPGTHNSKNDAWTEVRVRDFARDYTAEEMSAWLEMDQPAACPRKGSTENPFLRVAKDQEFKPPIDVEARLSAMVYHGNGEDGVHQTQLQVTASLMSAGWTVEDAAKKVLEATRKVGEATWDWRQEDMAIRRMCTDWLKKHPVGEVVSLNEKRSERQNEKRETEAKSAKGKTHVILGQGIVESLRQNGMHLAHNSDRMWLYSNGLWQELIGDTWKNWSARQVETGCRILKIVSTQRLVNETRAWLERNPDTFADTDRDDHKKIATSRGLLDWRTGSLEDYAPHHWATTRMGVEHDPEAECPKWQKMVHQCFDGDSATVLQEVFGAALIESRPRALTRALVLVGGSNSGKSTILNAMAMMLTDRINTTPIEMLQNPHGLQDFLRSAPWVLHEAFDQSKWHMSSTVKALLSGDPLGVNVKHGPLVTHSFRSPVFWGTNTPPQFKESSRAIANRIIILQARAQFDAWRPTGLAKEAIDMGFSHLWEYVLATERPGMLNWGIEGLKRAVAQGRFSVTEGVEEALRDMVDQANVVAKFVGECLDFDPDCMMPVSDFYLAFSVHWEDNFSRDVPSVDSVGRALSALACPAIGIDNKNFRVNNRRYYVGIKLNDGGRHHWQTGLNVASLRGDPMNYSSSVGETVAQVPARFDQYTSMRAVRSSVADEFRSQFRL